MRKGDCLKEWMGQGDECPCRYVCERLAIEREHDDEARIGTFKRTVPKPKKLVRQPVRDDFPLTDLEPWGLSVRVLDKCVENGCVTVGDVRACLALGMVLEWVGCDNGAVREIRAVLKRVDAAKRSTGL